MGRRFDGIKEDVHDLIGDWSSSDMDVCIDEEATFNGCVLGEFVDYWDGVSEGREPFLVAGVVVECVLAEEGKLPLAVVIFDEIGVFQVADDIIECRAGNVECFDEFRFRVGLVAECAEALVSFQENVGEVEWGRAGHNLKIYVTFSQLNTFLAQNKIDEKQGRKPQRMSNRGLELRCHKRRVFGKGYLILVKHGLFVIFRITSTNTLAGKEEIVVR